jgi:transposase
MNRSQKTRLAKLEQVPSARERRYCFYYDEVAGMDDRRVLNGIFWVLRSGAPWRDLPQCFGPPWTTLGN